MYICSYGSKRISVLICLRRVIESSMLPYSCLELSICSAYAERGQTNQYLKSRFRERIRYIKNNDPHSVYTLHILNSRHEYGNIDDTMTLLKQINTLTLLLPYEQMSIQLFHHNNELITEQHLNKHNPMFDLLHSNTTHHNPPDA